MLWNLHAKEYKVYMQSCIKITHKKSIKRTSKLLWNTPKNSIKFKFRVLLNFHAKEYKIYMQISIKFTYKSLKSLHAKSHKYYIEKEYKKNQQVIMKYT